MSLFPKYPKSLFTMVRRPPIKIFGPANQLHLQMAGVSYNPVNFFVPTIFLCAEPHSCTYHSLL